MSLFFDAGWFDARLAALGLDRAALAAAAGLDRTDLHQLFCNDRTASPAEIEAFARLLGADVVEVTRRSGVAAPETDPAADAGSRIESIEARLDAIDDWLAEFEKAKRKRA
jgi:transcriptional regulator with XRE-family HTH domain